MIIQIEQNIIVVIGFYVTISFIVFCYYCHSAVIHLCTIFNENKTPVTIWKITKQYGPQAIQLVKTIDLKSIIGFVIRMFFMRQQDE